jgi:hypothetical protein
VFECLEQSGQPGVAADQRGLDARPRRDGFCPRGCSARVSSRRRPQPGEDFGVASDVEQQLEGVPSCSSITVGPALRHTSRRCDDAIRDNTLHHCMRLSR